MVFPIWFLSQKMDIPDPVWQPVSIREKRPRINTIVAGVISTIASVGGHQSLGMDSLI